VTVTLDHDASPAPEPSEVGPPRVPRWSIVAFVLGGLAFLLIAGVALGGRSDDANGAADASEWKGRVLDPAPERPDATLIDTQGRPYDLRAETSGRFTMLFFGYTNCPDACPVQMAQLKEALDRVQLPVTVVFVTTDPARDTPERLRTWLDSFDTTYVGLTGTQEQIDALQRDMDVAVAIAEPAGPDGGYLVGHSTAVFAITEDDRAHLAYPLGTRQEDWVDDLPKAFAEPEWRADPA
jgi:protein SCO1/2